MNNVTLTGDAIKRISFLQEQESEDAKLRIEVHGGGCSGFSYGFRFDTEINGVAHSGGSQGMGYGGYAVGGGS